MVWGNSFFIFCIVCGGKYDKDISLENVVSVLEESKMLEKQHEHEL
jgi:hypothetical protein